MYSLELPQWGNYNEHTQHYISIEREKDIPKLFPFAYQYGIITFTTLLAFSADDKMMLFFLFFPENRIWHFMQIVSLGDNLHEMSNPVFWEK